MIATYVHDLNPVALRLLGGFTLKWYGLAYLSGFVAGFFLLASLGRRRLWVLKAEMAGDFVAAAAMFGVFVGGRVGYMLFYHYPKAGWSSFFHEPWQVLRVWEGGMASHGGIIGLVIFTWFYAKKHHVTWTGLGDALCVVAPVGLFFGRIANFINGELYGRIVANVPWAVKFPLSLENEPASVQYAAWDACIAANPAAAEMNSLTQLVEMARVHPEVSKALASFLPTRHPSQIYEALLEGGLLFFILWTVRVRFPKAPDGLLTGLFFGLYALFRIFSEQFREPDAAMVGPLSKGQFFSLFMFIFCAGFLWHAWRGWKTGKRGPGGNAETVQ